MRRFGRLAAGALIVGGGIAISSACHETAGATPGLPGPVRRVLFIGNSLTYVNDLPAVVRALASSAGASITTESVVQGGYSLEDHWNDGVAAWELNNQSWDVVVLQQGPSSLPASRDNLVEYVNRFAPLIRRAGAVPALYMVWPDTTRMAFFDDVRDSYRIAADSVHGLFLPCGEAWRAAWRRDPSLPLYGADGFHPGPMGTYLAAMVIVHRLTGRSPRGFATSLTGPGDGITISLDGPTARLLQDAALEVDALH